MSKEKTDTLPPAYSAIFNPSTSPDITSPQEPATQEPATLLYTDEGISLQISTPEQFVEAMQSVFNPLKLEVFGNPETVDNPSDLSLDPSLRYPPTLEHLSLSMVPLYPFLSTTRTLKEFTYSGTFNKPMDTLLYFLKNSPSLEHLNLSMEFQSSELRHSKIIGAITMGPRFLLLKICSGEMEDIKVLVSRISLESSHQSELKIIPRDPVTGFRTIIEHVDVVYPQAQEFRKAMGYVPGLGIRFFPFKGPNFTLVVRNDVYTLPSPLTFENIGKFSTSFNKIQLLTLKMSSYHGIFDPSLFPALEHLNIENDTMLSQTLSTLVSSPKSNSSPNLHLIRIIKCTCPEDFKEKLRKFVSNNQINCLLDNEQL